MVVVNLFAFRSSTPKFLMRFAYDRIGPDNDKFILAAAGNSSLVVAAWGGFKPAKERGQAVIGMLFDQNFKPQAIHLTNDGTPCHPLYLPKELTPFALGRSR